VSAPDYQYNAYFSQSCDGKKGLNAITAIALKINEQRLFINITGHPVLNKHTLYQDPHKDFYHIGHNSMYGSVSYKWESNIEVTTPEFHLIMERFIINRSIQKPGMVYYGKNCIVGYFNTQFKSKNDSLDLHGLLGQTAHHNHKENKIHGNEGQGEIEGTYQDYIVSGPFEGDFKYNRYSFKL